LFELSAVSYQQSGGKQAFSYQQVSYQGETWFAVRLLDAES